MADAEGKQSTSLFRKQQAIFSRLFRSEHVNGRHYPKCTKTLLARSFHRGMGNSTAPDNIHEQRTPNAVFVLRLFNGWLLDN